MNPRRSNLNYFHFGLDIGVHYRITYLYTKDIAAYVKTVYSVDYSVSGMTYWLKRNQFSYKKPSLVPGKANRETQQVWIAEYHKLRQNLPENETICFADGVHPTHNTQVSYGWIRKGESKEICSNTGRQRINLSGALDLVDKKLHFQEDPMLNAESTISFLQKLEKAYPNKKKVHLFLDNARYYTDRNSRVGNFTKRPSNFFAKASFSVHRHGASSGREI